MSVVILLVAAVLFLAYVVTWIKALVDLAGSRLASVEKLVWVVVLVVFPLLGLIAFLVVAPHRGAGVLG